MADEVKVVRKGNKVFLNAAQAFDLAMKMEKRVVELEAKLRVTERALDMACEEIEAYDNARVVLTEDFIEAARAELQKEGQDGR